MTEQNHTSAHGNYYYSYKQWRHGPNNHFITVWPNREVLAATKLLIEIFENANYTTRTEEKTLFVTALNLITRNA